MRFCGNCGTRLPEAAVPESQPTIAPIEEQLGVMMGSDLLERMRRAGLEATGQRRNVTVLFADLSGYTSLSSRIDSEDLYDIVQQYIRLLSNHVYRYEGIVDKFTGDGIMALFGAPISHENNAERAARAALDMQIELADMSRDLKKRMGIEIQARIGLHSGSVIVGGIGSDMLMNYTAIGDTVNLAHRIEEAAPPGAILISEAVYRQVRALFDCQQVSVLNPKGISHPVIAYRLADVRVKPGSVRGVEGLRAPMIGRDQELALLKKAVVDLTNNKQGQLVLITGEAGLGKSRLTAELKASLDLSTVRLLEGQSLAYRRTISYWIIREVFFSYLGLHPTAPPQQVSEKLGRYVYQVMGSQASETLPFLEHMLSLPYSDAAAAERIRHLDARQLRQQIFLAVRDLLLLEAYDRPLLIVLDDLHWADDASLELLLFLLDAVRQSPIFVLAISRSVLPGFLEKVVDWAGKNLRERFYQVPLRSLSPDQSGQLLYNLLLIPDIPDTLRQQILQRSSGVPFYLEEILRMMIDQGVLQNVNRQWQVKPGADLSAMGVPETLQELIMARFDRLNNTQRRVLQIAAVIGKDFSLPVLVDVMQSLDLQALRVTVEALVERDFILPQSGAMDTEFTFRHILMSDAIYGTILRKERSALHGMVADTIENLYADRLDEMVELLANHYRWSPRLDKALHYLILAGQRAARNHVNLQARQHFELALELLHQVEHQPYQKFQVYIGLGDALVFAGDYTEASQQFQLALDALAGLDASLYAEETSSLYRRIARTFERKGDYDQAVDYLRRAREALALSPHPHPGEEAEVWHDVGWIYFRRGNFAEAEQYLTRALELVESSNAYGVVASIYNRLGAIAYNQGDWEQAVRFLRKSISIRETIGDVLGLASSSNNLGNMEIEMGEFDNALEDLTRNYELVKRLGQVEGVAIALHNLGWLHSLRGEPMEADQALTQSLDLARQIGYSSLILEALKNIGELHLSLQNWEKARSVLREVVTSFEQLKAHDQLLHVYRLLGEAALGAGDMADAIAWAQKAENLALAFDADELPVLQQGELLRFRGMLAIEQGDWKTADGALQKSMALLKKLRSRLYLGKAIYQMGVLAESRGNPAVAQAYFSDAADMLKSIGAKLYARRAEQACSRLAA